MAELYRINWAGRESRQSARYFYDNRTRGGPPQFVIQRTIDGLGFIERAGVRTLVSAHHAMLFGHGDDSRYGYADESNGPYVLEFIAMNGPQCGEIFAKARQLAGDALPMPKQSESGRLFDEVVRRFQQKQFRDSFHESLLAYELLMALWREASQIPAERDPVQFAADYIERRFHTPITMDDVARAAGLSREHLSRELKRQWGVSPGKRLRELRLCAGRDLLASTDAPIEAIGPHCGYLDPDAFARAFTRRFQRSPRRYRQEAQGS